MNSSRHLVLALLPVLTSLAAAPLSDAQCQPEWLPGDGFPGIPGTVHTSTVWDPDGPGPQPPLLVVAGTFNFAGDVLAPNIASWNGSSWSPLGSGMDQSVRALAVLPSGELVAGGYFATAGGVPASRIARWDGQTWSALGSGIASGFTGINALAVLPGGELVAGGTFASAGGVQANNIARWDGAAWSALGSGTNAAVNALAVLPGGVLAAGGAFTIAGGTQALGVARWNGSAWAAVGGGAPETVYALAAMPNGDLIAGGNANMEGIGFVWRWNGSAWSTLDGVPESGPFGWVAALTVTPGGDVLVGGHFAGILIPGVGTAPANHVARWDGASWSTFGTGTDDGVETVTVLPEGQVFVGGHFRRVSGQPADRAAIWNGSSWSAMGTGMNASVYSLAELPSGGLVAGGDFYSAGSVPASRIALRTGGVWTEMGPGLNGTVRALAVMPSGDLVAGGDFTASGPVAVKNIARWTGASWQPLGQGIGTGSVGTRVQAIATLPNGDLVVGGSFHTAGGVPAGHVARWDGAAWHSMGPPPGPFQPPGLDDQVWALAVLPSGDVVAGGDFGNPGPSPAFIARWNGSSWQSMGPGMNSTVYALVVMPNGDLIAGGEFTSPASHIARWDGNTWTPLGAGVGGDYFPTVHALKVGPSGELYAAGDFMTAGGQPATRIARWDGTAWSALGAGLGLHPFSNVPALAVLSGGELIAAGGFVTATGRVSGSISTWACACYANCDGSTTAPVLNVADFSCFLQKFAAGNAYANCDGSVTPPVLNVADFSCFLQKFAAGCP